MKGKREIIAETFEPDEPCDCECKMINTLEYLRDLAVLQRQRINLLERRIAVLEMVLKGMDYDEEECECGCSG